MYSSPSVWNRSRSIRTQQSQILSYSVHTPRIVAFTYRVLDTRKVSQSGYVDRSNLVQKSRKTEHAGNQKKIKLMGISHGSSKHLKPMEVSRTSKPIKINLMSSRKTHQSRHDFNRQSQVSVRSQPVHMAELPNHITVSNFVDSISCDIFSACNQASGVDYGEKMGHPYERQQNNAYKDLGIKAIIQDLEKKKKTFEVDSSCQSENLRNFKKKNIFQTSLNLNTTGDISLNRSQRSRSRKSIFKPRERSTSNSRDRSIQIKKRIFTQIVEEIQRSPNFGVKNREESLDESEIPKNILESWQQFSESSHSWGQHSFSGGLGIVEEAGFEESAVREIQ